MRKNTDELLHEIARDESVIAFLTENTDEMLRETAVEYLARVAAEKGLSVADASDRSGRGDYVYKVFAGTRKASRDILVAIAFGMSMSAEETQTLLRLSGTARLDPRVRRDAVTLHALLKRRDISYLNELLFDLGERLY